MKLAPRSDSVDEVQHELEERESDEETEGAAHRGEDPAHVKDSELGVYGYVAPLDLGVN